MKLNNIIAIFSILSFTLVACSESEYVPKKKGFSRIDTLPHKYKQLTEDHPYTFEYSTQAKVLNDTNGLVEPHWIHVYYPAFHATIDITYKDLGKNANNEVLKLIRDANKLTARHQVKATSIEEQIYPRLNDHKLAFIYRLQGEVPSPFQFHFTDSTKHFLSACMYFDTATQNDSLEPVIKYLERDMYQMINTIKFK